MSRYSFHIGAGKTGSSSIQSFLRVNHKALSEKGFFVPWNKFSAEGRVTGEHVWGVQGLLAAENPDMAIAEAFDALDAMTSPDTTILISAENLSNLGNAQFFKQALESRDCSVVFYIRRQDEYLMSAWQQWYSKVETDLVAWLVKAFVQYGHWDKIIEQWLDVVGAGNISVRLFDRTEFVEGDLVKDYCSCVGIDYGADDIVTDIDAENISFSDAITDLVTGVPGLFKGSHDNDFYNFVGRLTGQDLVPEKKISLISKETRESIQYFYRSGNQTVCHNHFKGRRQLFQPVDHSKYQYLSEDALLKKQMQFLTRLVFEASGRQ